MHRVWETLSQTPQYQQPATLPQLCCLLEPGTAQHSSKITSRSSTTTCSVLYSRSAVVSCDSKLFLPPQLTEKGPTKPPCKRNPPGDYGCLGTQLPLRRQGGQGTIMSVPRLSPHLTAEGPSLAFQVTAHSQSPALLFPQLKDSEEPSPEGGLPAAAPARGKSRLGREFGS